MIDKKSKKFCYKLAISSPPQRGNFIKPSSLVRTSRVLVPNVPTIIPKYNAEKSMIHVCFSLYDKTGTYSKFTGTAMLSILENHNLPPSIIIHILHDNTLTNDNREKFIQIANRYGQLVKFYNVEEVYADKIEELKGYFQHSKYFRTIAMFYRLFVPHLFPEEIEKVIYFDCDIIVNLDIAELWQIEIGDYPLAVVTEIANGVSIEKYSRMVRDGVVKAETYFNSGVLLMNLKVLRNEDANISAGIKFRSEHPEYNLFDQEILN